MHLYTKRGNGVYEGGGGGDDTPPPPEHLTKIKICLSNMDKNAVCLEEGGGGVVYQI